MRKIDSTLGATGHRYRREAREPAIQVDAVCPSPAGTRSSRWNAVIALAGFILLTFTAGTDIDTANQGMKAGLLTVGLSFPFERSPCLLCRPARSEPASDFAAIPHPDGGPSRIILMRHADKPDDPDDDEGLSQAGVERAKHLATYIPQTFGKPDYILATAPSKHSNRPMETVAPLADALGMQVEDDIDNDDFENLVEEIFSNTAFRGKTIVICWHHGKIPAIAALLGATPGSYPDPWPEESYNVILDFRYDPRSGSPPTVTRIVEPF